VSQTVLTASVTDCKLAVNTGSVYFIWRSPHFIPDLLMGMVSVLALVLAVLLVGSGSASVTDQVNSFEFIKDAADSGKAPGGPATLTAVAMSNSGSGLNFTGIQDQYAKLPASFTPFTTSAPSWAISFWVKLAMPTEPSSTPAIFLSLCSTSGGGRCNESANPHSTHALPSSWASGIVVWRTTTYSHLRIRVKQGGTEKQLERSGFFSTTYAQSCYTDGMGCLVTLSFTAGTATLSVNRNDGTGHDAVKKLTPAPNMFQEVAPNDNG
jgi:hypothetical protein